MKQRYASILLTLASLIGLGISAAGLEQREVVFPIIVSEA
jgi:hypothetical protein